MSTGVNKKDASLFSSSNIESVRRHRHKNRVATLISAFDKFLAPWETVADAVNAHADANNVEEVIAGL